MQSAVAEAMAGQELRNPDKPGWDFIGRVEDFQPGFSLRGFLDRDYFSKQLTPCSAGG